MAITKEQKKEAVAKMSDIAKDAASFVFVGFKNLSGNETVEMRKTLREEGISYTVLKKRLMKLGLKDSGISGDLPSLEGEVAVAYGMEDPTAPARLVHEQAKKYEDKLSILGGVFENKFLDDAGMREIALIPPVPVLRGMFVNVINSPIQGLAVALGQIAEKKS